RLDRRRDGTRIRQLAVRDGRRLARGAQLAQQRAHLELGEEGAQLVAVGARPAERLEVETERHIPADGGERGRQAGRLGLSGERLPDLLRTTETDLLHLVEAFEDDVDGTDTLHERGRGLLADARDPGDVVD